MVFNLGTQAPRHLGLRSMVSQDLHRGLLSILCGRRQGRQALCVGLVHLGRGWAGATQRLKLQRYGKNDMEFEKSNVHNNSS